MVSKELQYGYSKGKAPRLCVKSFSSCFLGYWARVLLLRLFSFTAMTHAPHRQCPASCAKGLVRCVSDELFCILQALFCPQK